MSEASKPGPADPVPKAAFATVWLTLFFDLVAFGIIIPVLPYYAEHFGASPTQVTSLSAAFSLAQFVMSPVLGRLSDRFGRRSVMLISIGGGAVGMVTLGLAESLWMVYAARVFSGMCTANIATAYAYVADRVAPVQRAKYMGIMGSAIGLGFIFGPAIGGLLAAGGNPERAFFGAAGLAAVNFLMALRFLPESRPSTPRRPRQGSLFAAARKALSGTQLGWMVGITFLFYVAFAGMESTFALLMEARMGWGARETGYLFTGLGIVIAVTQGIVVGRLVRWLGEKTTLILGFVVVAAGLAATGSGPGLLVIAVGSAGIAAGNGLITPNISAIISRSAGPDQQGFNLGLNSSSAALARIGGPMMAGPLFEFVEPGFPMLAGAGLAVLAALVAIVGLRRPTDGAAPGRQKV